MTSEGRFHIVVVGSINSDYMGRGSTLPRPGTTLRGDTFYAGAGGKGSNQAVAAARLGVRVALVGKVGGDRRGRELVEHLGQEGVDTGHVGSEEQETSGAAIIQVDGKGEKQILMIPGANQRLSPSDVHAAEAMLRSAGAVVTQLEIPMPAVTAAVQLGHAAGACVILDPAPPAHLSDDLLRMVDIIRPNADEAEALTGVNVQDRESARKAAEALLERGVGAVAVGVGAHGNLLAWQGHRCWYPGIPVDSVDATGAGDAFVGALAAQIASGQDLEEAGRFANAAAALATTKLGAQTALPTRHDVLQLLAGPGG